jgi:AraC-like DNA-binding protein
MSRTARILATGNGATPRRTITALLAQMEWAGLDRAAGVALLAGAGLPERAWEEPDFPVSWPQEMEATRLLLATMDPARSLTAAVVVAAESIGIARFGVLGLAMQHAPTLMEALRVSNQYPQVNWGHCRYVVSGDSEATTMSFLMDRPDDAGRSREETDRLVEYCTLLDLLSARRMLLDIAGEAAAPRAIRLPWREPHDWHEVRDIPRCAVEFGADTAALIYAPGIERIQPLAANLLLFRFYEGMTAKLARMEADEIGTAEQVARWLWAYSPPMKKTEVASMLGMSERSLSRALRGEGTSYGEVFARVQSERARNLLRNPVLTVTEVGYRLGYSEPAAFSRAFTGWTGVAPSRWRAAECAAQCRDAVVGGLRRPRICVTEPVDDTDDGG